MNKEKAIFFLEKRLKQKRCVIEFWENDSDIPIYIKENLKELKEEVKAYEMAIEALKNQEEEKERIIRALEEQRTSKGFEMMRIDKAIEIVKRGGKECL